MAGSIWEGKGREVERKRISEHSPKFATTPLDIKADILVCKIVVV